MATITSITIENFKRIGDAVTIPIRPITLLFGKNSSGKSTVLQALHYMYEVSKHTGADPDRTDIGGDYIDLGDFCSLVHRHELDRRIRIRIELDIEFGKYIDLFREYIDLNPALSPVNNPESKKLKSMWKEVVIGWNEEEAYAYFESVSYGLNGVELKCITPTRRPETFPSNTVGSNGTQWICSENLMHWNIKHPCINQKKKKRILEILFGTNFDSEFTNKLDNIMHTRMSNIRYLGPLRKVPPRNFDPQRTPNESLWATGLEAWNQLGRDPRKIGVDPTLIETINYYMKDVLKLGYTINRKEYVLLDMDSKIMTNMKEIDSIDRLKEQVVSPIKQLPRQIRLKLHNEENDIDLDPLDVGLGIPQVIPVLVGVADTRRSFAEQRIFAIEDPELHLHPAAQVALGDVFIDGIQNRDLNLLIETHSEHLLLRLLRRVRETNIRNSKKHEWRQTSMTPLVREMPETAIQYSEDQDSQDHQLTPDDLSVVYVRPTPEGIKFTPINVTDDGDFDASWPEGFFEERMEELF